MPASAERTFDLIHDYARRLSWDTMLRSAYIDGGPPGKGAVAVCTARRLLVPDQVRDVPPAAGGGDQAGGSSAVLRVLGGVDPSRTAGSGAIPCDLHDDLHLQAVLGREGHRAGRALGFRRETSRRLAALSAALERQVSTP